MRQLARVSMGERARMPMVSTAQLAGVFALAAGVVVCTRLSGGSEKIRPEPEPEPREADSRAEEEETEATAEGAEGRPRGDRGAIEEEHFAADDRQTDQYKHSGSHKTVHCT